MMMPEMAFVTAIRGVCSAWLTFQITWKPTKQASAKTMKWAMKLGGAKAPTTRRRTAPMASSVTWLRVAARKAAISAARFSSGVGSFGFSFFAWAAIAFTFGGGGGKVMAPACVTVAPRMTSSSMLWTRTPSFPGVRSVSMWRMLVA